MYKRIFLFLQCCKVLLHQFKAWLVYYGCAEPGHIAYAHSMVNVPFVEKDIGVFKIGLISQVEAIGSGKAVRVMAVGAVDLKISACPFFQWKTAVFISRQAADVFMAFNIKKSLFTQVSQLRYLAAIDSDVPVQVAELWPIGTTALSLLWQSKQS